MLKHAILLVTLLSGCGGSTPAAEGPTGPARGEAPRDPASLGGATVYDADGKEVRCAPPQQSCPDMATPRDFLDACKLGGYQIRQCGCEEVCTGNVMAKKAYYDADGATHDCAPEQASCTPPDTSAAFQDACNDAGNKLVVCGCQWLCDGPLKH